MFLSVGVSSFSADDAVVLYQMRREKSVRFYVRVGVVADRCGFQDLCCDYIFITQSFQVRSRRAKLNER